jgi:hypothetical protein
VLVIRLPSLLSSLLYPPSWARSLRLRGHSSSCPAKHPATADSKAEREISPNCWRRLMKLGVCSAYFVKPSHPRAALPRTCTEWKPSFNFKLGERYCDGKASHASRGAASSVGSRMSCHRLPLRVKRDPAHVLQNNRPTHGLPPFPFGQADVHGVNC